MRPLDTIRTIGRPIAYHSALARHVGGVCTAIFLGQLMYWDEICKDDLGVYKTSEEWEAETGLSYREQATARKKLREMGLLVETVKRLQHRIYYKLDRDAFNEWIEGIVAEESSETRESTKAQFPNDENAIGGQHNPQLGDDGKRKSYIEKITTETTAEITNTPSSDSVEPDHVPEPKSRFQEFWGTYPSTGRRVAKAKCAQVWKTKKLESVADDILDHLRAVKTTQQWTTGYEPAPLTYLNQRRWEDGLPEVVPVQGVHVIGRSAAPTGGMNKQEALEARNMDVAQRWAQRGM